jgi:ribonuclease HII
MNKPDKDRLPLPAPDLSFEIALWETGIEAIAGIDEAGRGALAGPVAAAALILPRDPSIAVGLRGVRDSKQMTPIERARWSIRLRKSSLSWGVGFASHMEIDQVGIVPATRLAMQRAVESLEIQPEHLLIDYLLLPELEQPQTAIVKGDARSLSIAGASILAKTARDALLLALEVEFPGYGFKAHKGYGTPQHLVALDHLGPCSIHRRSFAPLRDQGKGDRG